MQLSTTWSPVDQSYRTTITYPSHPQQCICHVRAVTHHYYQPDKATEEDLINECRKRKKARKEKLLYRCLMCLQGSARYRKKMRKRANSDGINTVSQIDKISRVLFPFSFIFLNIVYWIIIT